MAEAYHVSGESPKEFLDRQKPCPSVVPMLSRDHVFRRVAVACDSFRKVLSHLFLRRTCLTARCHGISAPLRITLVREFNCADTVMHERYPRKRKTHRKTDAQSSLYIPRHRNTEMFLKCENFFKNIFCNKKSPSDYSEGQGIICYGFCKILLTVALSFFRAWLWHCVSYSRDAPQFRLGYTRFQA